ncbi:hypothetical protein BH10PSE17_BH10PSE17_18080 [soil metagenome]
MVSKWVNASTAIGLAALTIATSAQVPLRKDLSAPVKAAPAASRPVTQLIVKFRDSSKAGLAQTMSVEHMASMGKSAGDNLKYKRAMSGDAHVLALSRGMTVAEARAVAARLKDADPTIEYAAPDVYRRAFFSPNDPIYQTGIALAGGARQGQWNLLGPTETYTYVMNASSGSSTVMAIGGANMTAAWDITRGGGVVVGVVDTGVVSHADLNGGLVSGAPSTSGYDFVNDTDAAGDGNLRDSDPSDPGDFTTANQCDDGGAAETSSWHGSHVSGVVAAVTNNALGIASVAPDSRVVMARALGRCGGLSSDIVDAMRWAAGLAVVGVPANTHPARVINLSLGGSVEDGPDPCSPQEQSAVNDIRAAGGIIVAATGNEASSTLISSPSNCTGVIAVTAHTVEGDSATYANVGDSGTTTSSPTVTNTTTISAPGGGCGNESFDSSQPVASRCSSPNQFIFSTVNSGTTTPTANGDSYAGYAGTSMASPHVAAIVALMLSINTTLKPDAVTEIIKTTARPFPAGTYCLLPGAVGTCGAGMIDATAARTERRLRRPVLTLAPTHSATGGTAVTLTATATVAAARPNVPATTVLTYRWVQLACAAVTVSAPTAAATAFTAPAAAGDVVVAVDVTDGNGYVTRASSTVTVAAAPAPPPSSDGGGGGGGSTGALGLLLLTLGAFAMRGNRVLRPSVQARTRRQA